MEEAGTNYRDAAVRKGARHPTMLYSYVLIFVHYARCTYIVIYNVAGICVQRPSCIRCFLFCFLKFPLAAYSCCGAHFFYWGPNALSAALTILRTVGNCSPNNIASNCRRLTLQPLAPQRDWLLYLRQTWFESWHRYHLFWWDGIRPRRIPERVPWNELDTA
jgi:hypothetical protein